MKVSEKSKVMLLAAGLAIFATTATSAQDRAAVAAQKAAMLAKSLDLVAGFQSIENDRAEAERQLLAKWEAVLDPNVYDIRNELASIVSRTPSWQLFGASLANDFSSMIRILQGKESAGRTINAAYGMESDSPNVLGSFVDELVYTPITPCRMVDTRGTGARTGILAAGAARNFDLTTTGFAEGQGGSLACAGLPAYSHLGWAVNITTTGNVGNGWLTVWPFGGTEPLASQVNYAAGVWSIANGLNLTGCDGCGDDVTVRANAAATHVIIDVVGFYGRASVTDTTVSRIAGTPTSVGGLTKQYVTAGPCPAGTTLVSGETSHGGFDLAMGEDEQVNSTTWHTWVINNDLVARTVTVFSRCLTTPIIVQ